MKNNVLIVSHAMEIGGAEKALLGLLESFDYKKWEVDLFLFHHSGELFELIPSQVNILPEKNDYSCMAVPIKKVLREKQFRIAGGRAVGKIIAKIQEKRKRLSSDNDLALEYSHKYTWKYMSEISLKSYDLAISFLTPHYYTLNKVKAKKKIAWIHTDYSTIQIDTQSQIKMWQGYDYIASISEEVTRSFLKIFPEFKDKIILFPNIIPLKYLLSKVNEFPANKEMIDTGDIKILSIGRFCYAKNFDSVPAIANELKNKGLKFTWYLIGFGSDEDLIKEKIHDFNVENDVLILGKKSNPYPYIKECDLYVQPSRYEGKCVSVIEAQILHKPVVITNYPTAFSQLSDGIDGIIVPQDIIKCSDEIYNLVNDQDRLKAIISGTFEKDYSNTSNIKILEMIVNGEI